MTSRLAEWSEASERSEPNQPFPAKEPRTQKSVSRIQYHFFTVRKRSKSDRTPHKKVYPALNNPYSMETHCNRSDSRHLWETTNYY